MNFICDSLDWKHPKFVLTDEVVNRVFCIHRMEISWYYKEQPLIPPPIWMNSEVCEKAWPMQTKPKRTKYCRISVSEILESSDESTWMENLPRDFSVLATDKGRRMGMRKWRGNLFRWWWHSLTWFLLGLASMKIIKNNTIIHFFKKMCRLFDVNYISMKPLQEINFQRISSLGHTSEAHWVKRMMDFWLFWSPSSPG